MKRVFDFAVSLAGLLLLSPMFLLVAVAIKLDSAGRVFFCQERLGKDFRPFRIYKFRSMVEDASRKGPAITATSDVRITRVGRILRATKIDELPQLINVLKGEMSLVGPRPEVPAYVELFKEDYRQILSIRPGITDLASLKYRDEGAILERSANPEADYVNQILPDKMRLAKAYVDNTSLLFDIKLIVKTVQSCFK